MKSLKNLILLGFLLIKASYSFSQVTIYGADISYHNIVQDYYEITLTIYTPCLTDTMVPIKIIAKPVHNSHDSIVLSTKAMNHGIEEIYCYNGPYLHHHHEDSCSTYLPDYFHRRKWVAKGMFYHSDTSCEYTFSWQGPQREYSSKTDSANIYINAFANLCKTSGKNSPYFIAKPQWLRRRQECKTTYFQAHSETGSHLKTTYELVPAMKNESQSLNYNTGITYYAPFAYYGYPDTTFTKPQYSTCTGFRFDKIAGSMTFSTKFGLSTPVAVRVNKYDNDNLVSSIVQDMIYDVLEWGAGNTPIISGINGRPDLDTIILPDTTCCFLVHSFDADGDTVKFKYSFEDPGAIIEIDSGKKWPRLKFCWKPGKDKVRSEPYLLKLRAYDFGLWCEGLSTYGTTTKTISIYVVSSLGINNKDSQPFKIFPNPVNDKLTIEGLLSPSSLVIVDVQGRFILEQKLNKGINNIDLSQLHPGIFFIGLESKNGIKYEKIVKY